MAHASHDCDHEHDSRGLSGPDLSDRMAAADRRCADEGQRLTAPRRRVLELLLKAGQPVKAYDLIAGFGEDGAPAKPPTVYRALDFLSKAGFAHRIESLNAYVACRHSFAEGDESHAAAFLICDCCGDTREIEPAGASDIEDLAGTAGYSLTGVTIEAHGLCAACRT